MLIFLIDGLGNSYRSIKAVDSFVVEERGKLRGLALLSSIRRIVLCAILVTATVHAHASGGVPELLPFQGRATDTSGNPVTTAASFKFRIYPPSGNCYLYEETQTITPNDFGFFSTVLGSAANSTGPGNSFAAVYSNQTTVPDSCATTYTPAVGDWRRVEIVVNGIPMPTMQTIASTPFSINSGMLDGLLSSNFLQTNGSASQSALNLLVSGQDASSLHNHDSLYAKLSGSNTLSGNTTTTGSVYANGVASHIGIGTNAPGADLEIARSAPSLILRATAGSGQSSSITFNGGSNVRARIEAAEGANTLRFLTGTSEAMLIDANQNVTVDGSLSVNKTLNVGRYNSSSEPALLSSLGASGATGTVWFNTDTNQPKILFCVRMLCLFSPCFSGQLISAAMFSAVPPSGCTSYVGYLKSLRPQTAYPLSESSGTIANDAAGTNPGIYMNTPTLAQPSLFGLGSTSVAFSAASSEMISTAITYSNPNPFTIIGWFNTLTAGGALVGFSDAVTGTPQRFDRVVYIDSTGKLNFGAYAQAALLGVTLSSIYEMVVTSTVAVKDGNWHMFAASIGAGGQMLYVDNGSTLTTASNTNTIAGNYAGTWRLASGYNVGWPNANGVFFNGNMAHIALFTSQLTLAQVTKAFTLGRLCR